MPVLSENFYGKSRVRLLKVIRAPEAHTVREYTVGVYLTGDFDACFLQGDNTGIMATDTMKNTVYAVARNSAMASVESFALELANFLRTRNPRAASIRIVAEEKSWAHLRANYEEHSTAFLQRGPELATATVLLAGDQATVTAGVRDLVLLKTAQSAFHGFDRDSLTTLPETSDRLLGTEATIDWIYATPPADFAAARAATMDTLLSTFATHDSLSVQHTLYAMAEAALAAHPILAELSLSMPNRHNLPVVFPPSSNLDNPNTIFMPTDEPHGLIHARVIR